jgi:uncharacterized membrane protein
MSIQQHIRRTFLAGAFSAMPIAITAFLVWWINEQTAFIPEHLLGRRIPFFGVLVSIAAIYLIGLAVNSFIGRYCISSADRILEHVPGLKGVYAAWKHVSFTPGGGEGTFSRVVLVPDESGQMRLLGFCSGEPLAGAAEVYCVFIPNAPNPIQGRVCFVRQEKICFLEMGNEEAFKVLLSTGNYVPKEIAQALK